MFLVARVILLERGICFPCLSEYRPQPIPALHIHKHNIYFHDLPFSLLSSLVSSQYLQNFWWFSCAGSAGIEHGRVYANVGGVTISDPDCNCEVTFGQVWWPILGICALHLTHPMCTHTAVNTHTPWTHTRSSGQPFFMLRRPGSSRGFGALLKGTSVVVLRVKRALYIHSPHLQFLPARDSNSQPLDYKSKSLTIRPRLPNDFPHDFHNSTGAAETVILRHHWIRPLHFNNCLVQLSYQIWPQKTTEGSPDCWANHWYNPPHSPRTVLIQSEQKGWQNHSGPLTSSTLPLWTVTVWSTLQSSEHQNDQTQEQFLPSSYPSHEHLSLNVEHTTLLYIIYLSHILIFPFQICTYQTCTHIIVYIIYCVFAILYIAYLYSILLLSVSCPVAVILLHCGASVSITNSSYV